MRKQLKKYSHNSMKHPLECPDYTIVELPEKLIPDLRPHSRKLQPFETLTDSGKRKRIGKVVSEIATVVSNTKLEMDCPIPNTKLIGQMVSKVLHPKFGELGKRLENEEPGLDNPVG